MGWLVTDRAVAVRLLADDRLGLVGSGPVMAALAGKLAADTRLLAHDISEFAARIMLQAAPARHLALRSAFGRFFTADAVDALLPSMRSAAERVIGRFVVAGGGEFMTAVAFRYAIEVGSTLLGVPPEQFARLHKLSQQLALVAYAGRLPDPSDAVRAGHAALCGVRELIRAARPAAPAGSVLAAWSAGAITELSEEDIEANCVMLVQASLETVAGMLGNAAALILADHGALADPARRRQLVADGLRATPPLKTLERVVREPLELAGVAMRPGQIVSVQVAEANRPDATGTGGRAVFSFGWGPYRCLGARMADREARELFDALARLAPDARLVEQDVERVRHIRFDMPRRLAVRCG
jgi:cytochrome P450